MNVSGILFCPVNGDKRGSACPKREVADDGVGGPGERRRSWSEERRKEEKEGEEGLLIYEGE